MCWELVTINKDKLNGVGAAIYQKPTTNECYEKRKRNRPPMCKNNDDANAAWYDYFHNMNKNSVNLKVNNEKPINLQ